MVRLQRHLPVCPRLAAEESFEGSKLETHGRVIAPGGPMPITAFEAVVKFVLILAVAALGIVFFSGRLAKGFDHGPKSPQASISTVSELLRRASAGEPLDGRQRPDGRWVKRMTRACAKRERLLAALPRPATVSGIAARGTRILAIQRAYAARVSGFRQPAGYLVEARELRHFNASQQRILERVVAAARAGDLAGSSREAVALRELAGRANTVLLQLGLAQCAFGSSGMPL
jgi:hypothetical protein